MQVLETPRLSSEINVAPMIDVLLVLLVVFMLSMTVWRFIPMNVPPPHPVAGRPQEPPIVLDLQPDHQFAINGRVVPKAELGSRLAALYANQVWKLHRASVSKSEIARRLEIGRTSVRRILAAQLPSRA